MVEVFGPRRFHFGREGEAHSTGVDVGWFTNVDHDSNKQIPWS